jgi:hypothetical protein
MTAFDPIKALRDELTALADVERAIRRRENACEAAISEAETELNAVRKIRGWLRIQIEQTKHKLLQIERDQQP